MNLTVWCRWAAFRWIRDLKLPRTAEALSVPRALPLPLRAMFVGEDGAGRPEIGAAFYQAHWYHTPWLFVLEAVVDTSCLENAAWDLAYLTELDPIWGDALASFVLAPESAIFANPMAVAACAMDCTAASVMNFSGAAAVRAVCILWQGGSLP